jgi:NADP-dependent 3-hydroxy acid dehydrogenase YdfG
VGVARSWDGAERVPGVDCVSVDFQGADKEATVAQIVHRIGEMDAMVVTAGVGIANPIWGIAREHLDEMTFANFQLPALILHHAAHATQHLLFTASIAGVRVREGSSVYAGTKAGLIGMIDAARREMPDHKLQTISFDNVNAVGPRKVLDTYEFMLKTKAHLDVHLSR